MEGNYASTVFYAPYTIHHTLYESDIAQMMNIKRRKKALCKLEISGWLAILTGRLFFGTVRDRSR